MTFPKPKLTYFIFFFFFISLNQSFWLDEAISAQVIKNYSFINIITRFSPTDFHPPLFYLLLKIWSLIFGTSVFGLRLFSLTCSSLTGLFLYKLNNILFPKKSSLLAVALLFLNPLFVYYSQELRMYSLVTFFLTAATYYFFLIQKQSSSSKTPYLFFNLFIFLSFLSFYGSIFYIAALYLLLFINKKNQSVVQISPWIYS